VRDAQGNVMAMYNHTSTFFANNNNYVSESFSISEWNLYGSSRLGIRSADKTTDVIFLASRNYNWINNTVTNEYIAPTASFTYKKYRVLGVKTFELTNHLGNVIATISDRKLMVQDSQTPGFVHHYKPEILSIGEQYAFGMSMPGRTFSVENYRYGFNGKENQDELLGEDNAQDFGARMYDARVGRWWGLDPNQNSYAHLSPYNAMENNPIYFNDPDGKDATITIVGNSLIISTKIYITGMEANEKLANEIKEQIIRDWDKGWKYKGYNVKFNVDVVVYTGEMDPNSNLIHITNSPKLLFDGYRSFVHKGNSGNWHSRLNEKAKKFHWSHEFGHLLGIMDGYIEQERYTSVQEAEPIRKTYIKENYGPNNMMSSDNGVVEQKNIDWLGDYAFKSMLYTNGPSMKTVNIKGPPFIGPALTKNDIYEKKFERQATYQHSPKKNGSQKSQKKSGNGGHTRSKNPRFL
jgi:RHS repeat-associated protein